MGLLGALLPFYRVEPPIFIGTMTDVARLHPPTPSLLHIGAIGVIVMLVAIALGIGPLVTLPTRTLTLTGFGLAAMVLGMVLGDFLQSFQFGRIFADGFYCALLGFGLLTYVYARQASVAT